MARLIDAAVHAGLTGVIVAPDDLPGATISSPPAILVLDAEALGEVAGSVTLAAIRERFPRLPIVVIDDGKGLDHYGAGATAVLPPGLPSEIISAQVTTLLGELPLHRVQQDQSARSGRFRYRAGRRAIEVDGRELPCSGVQVRILAALIHAHGQVVPTWDLRRAAGNGGTGPPPSVVTQMQRLRSRLEAFEKGLGSAIETVRGEGYRLRPPRAPDRTDGAPDALTGGQP